MTLLITPDQVIAMAGKVDQQNDQIQGDLRRFKSHADSIAHTAWQGDAYRAYQDTVARWDADATKLQQALHTIAETMRSNAKALADASEEHAHGISQVGGGLS